MFHSIPIIATTNTNQGNYYNMAKYMNDCNKKKAIIYADLIHILQSRLTAAEEVLCKFSPRVNISIEAKKLRDDIDALKVKLSLTASKSSQKAPDMPPPLDHTLVSYVNPNSKNEKLQLPCKWCKHMGWDRKNTTECCYMCYHKNPIRLGSEASFNAFHSFYNMKYEQTYGGGSVCL